MCLEEASICIGGLLKLFKLVFKTLHHNVTWLGALVDLVWPETYRFVNHFVVNYVGIHESRLRCVMVLGDTLVLFYELLVLLSLPLVE